MLRTIKIGDAEVKMMTNAASPYRYKQIFREDMLPKILGEPTDAEATGIFMKLGFVYAKQAEGADLSALTEDDYIKWLEQFEFIDYLSAATEIGALYTASAKGTVTPKK